MEIAVLEAIRELKSLIIKGHADNWMTLKEVQTYTHLSESTIRRYIDKGTLKASQKTGRLLFKRSDVDRFLM